MGSDQEIVDYLKDGSILVWSRPANGPFEGPQNWNSADRGRVDGLFFYATRCNNSTRLYGWGGIGRANFIFSSFDLSSSEAQSQYGIFSNISPSALASEDSYDEAFPHRVYGFVVTNSSPTLLLPHVPTTEEFFARNVTHNPLQDIVCIAAGGRDSIGSGPHFVLVCTSSGALYAGGFTGTLAGFTGDTSNPVPPFPIVAKYNQMGLGDVNPRGDETPPTLISVRSSTYSQSALQRVYGDSPTFAGVKFVKTQASSRAGFALDEDGFIWMSGFVQSYAEPTEFPENSINLPYFRKTVVSQYYDSSATLVSGDLRFVDFWASECEILALTADGRLFGKGRELNTGPPSVANGFMLGNARQTRLYHEVGGFVDTVTVLYPARNFHDVGLSQDNTREQRFQRIEFSPPDNPYGTRATGVVIMTRVPGQLEPGSSLAGDEANMAVGVSLTNPGWGYTSPPTITVIRESKRHGFCALEFWREAEFATTIFTGTWKHASMCSRLSSATIPDSRRDPPNDAETATKTTFAAVSSEGVAYTWGRSAGTGSCASPRRIGRQFQYDARRGPNGEPIPANTGWHPDSLIAELNDFFEQIRPFGTECADADLVAYHQMPTGYAPLDVLVADAIALASPIPQPAVYEKIYVGNRFGVLLDVDGKVSFWGQTARTPDNVNRLDLTTLASVNPTLGAFSYVDAAVSGDVVALLRDDGTIWTYGVAAPGLGQGKTTYADQVSNCKPIAKVVGSATWSKVFPVSGVYEALRAGFYAVRAPEELDPLYDTRLNPLEPFSAALSGAGAAVTPTSPVTEPEAEFFDEENPEEGFLRPSEDTEEEPAEEGEEEE
jgi:hypothetical protein